MDEILKIFFEECDDFLPQLEEGLNRLLDNKDDIDTIHAIFRAVHSIKGGAASFGLERLVSFAHIYENALDKLRSGELVADRDNIGVFFASMDILSDLVIEAKSKERVVSDAKLDNTIANLRNITTVTATLCDDDHSIGEMPIPDDFTPIPVDLSSFNLEESEETSPDPTYLYITFRPHCDLYLRGDDARNLLNSLYNLVTPEERQNIKTVCNTKSIASLHDSFAEAPSLSWEIYIPQIAQNPTVEDIKDVFDWVDDVCDITIDETHAAPHMEDENTPSPNMHHLGEQEGSLSDDRKPVEIDDQLQPSIPKPASNKTDYNVSSIRVDAKRLDLLMDMVGEVVIAQASLKSAMSEKLSNEDDELTNHLANLESLIRDVQSSVMAMRAQPIANVFQRMKRVVREASMSAQKDILFDVEGEDTEVDRRVVENINEPLTHIIRNAIDHGIETPDERLEKGKSKEGHIRLSATHRSGRIVIEVCDDGRGINHEKVKQIAVERGLISDEAYLSEEEINELIFAPGFSTATSVSDLSGRGVGMDVVRSSIQKLGGRVMIKTTPGLGSIFVLSLPLTLDVLDGMLIECEGMAMVVPIVSVVELIMAKPKQDVHTLPDGGHVLSVRGTCIPLIYLTKLFNLPPSPRRTDQSSHHDPLEEEETALTTLVVENEEGDRIALVVDAIRDQTQVVIKSIEKNYRRIKGISAATILGDGRVSLILDIPTLISSVLKRSDTYTRRENVLN